MASDWLSRLAGEAYCYLTTTGRRTGNPHTIEIWFAAHDGRLYLLCGSRHRSDWVRNLKRNPQVQVRIGGETRTGQAQVVDAEADPEEDALARRLLAAKYQNWREGQPLSAWARTALPVVIGFDDFGGDGMAGADAGRSSVARGAHGEQR
ncbi:MAG: nitroreductase family deazaflavin-dependent oxidoreductase [Chloroflexota bacterium]